VSGKDGRVTREPTGGLARLEAMISYILITGVVASLVLEAAGLFLFYREHATLAISYDRRLILHAHDFFEFLAGLFTSHAAGGDGAYQLMALGMAILILTPYARAVLSVVYFASRRDFTYLAVTLFVLIVLTASMLR
jgi:uncharacterized membrane protein